MDTGVPYAIIRPTIVFGEGDLLLNNMAWALRRSPVFPVFGDGNYRIQPIFAADLATQAVVAGCQSGSLAVDAAGPDAFTFEELLHLLASAVNARVRLVHTPASDAAPTGPTKLGDWLGDNGDRLGLSHVHQLRRNFR